MKNAEMPASAVPVEIAPGRSHHPISRLDRFAAFFLRGKKARLRNTRPLVSFTFDDIAISAYMNGAAILEEHGVAGTFYVSAGLCGRSYDPWLFADEDAIAEIARHGHEIGCHTHSHSDLQQLGPEEFAADLRANRERLGALQNAITLENFAYPYGSVGLAQKRQAARHFVSCRGVRAGVNTGRIDLGHLRAVPLYDSSITDENIARLLRQTVEQNGWLIFYTHDVWAPPSDQGTSPALMRATIGAALDAGCSVVPVREALRQARITGA